NAAQVEAAASTAGRDFTNGADIRAFLTDREEIEARKPDGEVIKLGFASTEHAMTKENNPAFRDDNAHHGFHAAVVGSAGFYRFMADNVKNGKAAVFHGDKNTKVRDLSDSVIPIATANERAKDNFIASAEVIEARQVA